MQYREVDDVPIKREECHYCFEQKSTQNGLYVCLFCDSSCCENHVKIHYAQTGHNEFLRIQYVPKEKDNLPEQLKFKQIDEISEQVNQLYQYANDQLTEISEPTDEQMVTAALIADAPISQQSRYLKQTQQCFNPFDRQKCLHFDAIQAHQQSPLSSLKCGNCELDKNLWLCLQCGKLMCGRKNWDGSGGNGHALQHSKEENHHCVLKLTSCCSSLQEVYCYQCDDEIRIDDSNREKLSKLLEQFQLEYLLKRSTGAELSLEDQITNTQLLINQQKQLIETELSLEQYNKLDLLPMQNTGNTCYANCIINSLINLNITNAKQFANHQQKCKIDSQYCPLCQMARLLNNQRHIYSNQFFRVSPRSHATALLLSLCSYMTQQENIGRQQDALEFMQILMQQLNNNQLQLPAPRKEIQCNACGYKKFSLLSPQQYISLTCNFFDGLQNHPNGLQLDLIQSLQKDLFGLQKCVFDFKCSQCGAQNQQTSDQQLRVGQSYIDQLPESVCVVINRLCYDPAQQKVLKLNTRIQNVLDIDLSTLYGQKYEIIQTSSNIPNSYTENIKQLIEFGVTEQDAIVALYQASYNMDNATSLIFDNQVKMLEKNKQNAIKEHETRIKGEKDENIALTNKLIEKGNSLSRSQQFYSLKAFVCHIGQSYDCGHYVCYCKTEFGWIKCNDDQFSKVEDQLVEECAAGAYILFYQQK